jgi:hypothetical protein
MKILGQETWDLFSDEPLKHVVSSVAAIVAAPGQQVRRSLRGSRLERCYGLASLACLLVASLLTCPAAEAQTMRIDCGASDVEDKIARSSPGILAAIGTAAGEFRVFQVGSGRPLLVAERASPSVFSFERNGHV